MQNTLFQSGMEAAFYDGLATNGSTSLHTIATSCSTGNCTWPEYPSLGVCATVVDLSTSIITNPCNLTTLGEVFEEAGLENPGYPCYNYTLPFQSTNIQYTASFSAQPIFFGNATLSNLQLVNDPEGMQYVTITSSPGSSNFSFLDAYLMYQPGLQESINSTLASPVAYGISFGLCVQTYNTTVSGGNASTSIISSQLFDSNMTETVSSPLVYALEGPSSALVSISGVDFGFTEDAVVSLTLMLASSFEDDCFWYLNKTQDIQSDFEPFCTSSGDWGSIFLTALETSDPFSVTKRLTQNIATSLSNA